MQIIRRLVEWLRPCSHQWKVFSVSHIDPVYFDSVVGHNAIAKAIRASKGSTSVVQRCSVCGGLQSDSFTGVHRIEVDREYTVRVMEASSCK